ncbi:hypothetical protein [Microbacterium sp. GXS0129]|uniref:hypothetical protein n=1 Tax=Microbacterium sp. GXS0129 TaxID=3377836 RepID=UPI00383A8774
MDSRASARTRGALVVQALPGIVLHLILSVVGGLVVFLLRLAAAGCGESGRQCNFAAIGIGQNSLVFVVPAIWALTAAAALVSAASSGKPANRVIARGVVATGVYLLVAAGLTLLGLYVL